MSKKYFEEDSLQKTNTLKVKIGKVDEASFHPKFFHTKQVINSHKHKKHKFYSANKYHLKLKIKSVYLSSISRINAQKIVMKVLKEDLNTKIHALEISIDK